MNHRAFQGTVFFKHFRRSPNNSIVDTSCSCMYCRTTSAYPFFFFLITHKFTSMLYLVLISFIICLCCGYIVLYLLICPAIIPAPNFIPLAIKLIFSLNELFIRKFRCINTETFKIYISHWRYVKDTLNPTQVLVVPLSLQYLSTFLWCYKRCGQLPSLFPQRERILWN